MKRLLLLVPIIVASCAYAMADSSERPTSTTASTTTSSPVQTTVPPSTTIVPTTSTSTTSTTTTSTLVPTEPVGDRCLGWGDTALSVGWNEAELNTLLYVLYKESTCNPDSHNPYDPATGSYGLSQINGFWCLPNKYNPIGWLQEQGILTTCNDLYDPRINLTAALLIWKRSGWSPWNI